MMTIAIAFGIAFGIIFVLMDAAFYCCAAWPDHEWQRLQYRKDFWIPGAGFFAVYRYGWR